MHKLFENMAAFWGAHLSNVIGIIVILLAGVFGSTLAKTGFGLLMRWSNNHGHKFRAAVLGCLLTPAVCLIWGLVTYFIVLAVSAPLKLNELLNILPVILKIFVLLVTAWASLRVVAVSERAYPAHIWHKHGKTPDPMLVDAIAKITRILVVTIIGLMILRILNFSIASLLAFGGVAGIAVGFAAQGVTANLFGALVVYLDQPFKVGEWIVLPTQNVSGTVEHIGWRTTTVRGFDTRPYYVPNQIFNSSVVQTPPRMQARQINSIISIRYVDFDKLARITADFRAHVDNHKEIDQSLGAMVYFQQYGNYGLQILVWCFTRTVVWQDSLAIQERLLIELGQIVRRHGAELAVPISQVELTSSSPFSPPQPPV
jgi:MscS family membrane protein